MSLYAFCALKTWQNNMTKTSEAKIKNFDGDDFTCVTFQPDLTKFKMDQLDKDIVALLTRRAYDVAGSCKGVKVILNGKKLPVSHNILHERQIRLGKLYYSYSHDLVYRLRHQHSGASSTRNTYVIILFLKYPSTLAEIVPSYLLK